MMKGRKKMMESHENLDVVNAWSRIGSQKQKQLLVKYGYISSVCEDVPASLNVDGIRSLLLRENLITEVVTK